MRSGISILLMACCATAVCAREEVSRDFQKTVPLPGGRSFRIEHSQGNINIHTQTKAEVDIRASIKCSANREADARTLCDQIKILVEETGSGAWVRTEYPRGDFFGGFHNVSYSVNYDIGMPETAPLEVRNRFGAVNVTSLHAAVTINNSNGRVAFTAGRGRQRIENSFGEVQVAGNDGDVTIVNSNGLVTASDVTGAVDIHNRFEAVRVTNAGKKVDVNCSNCSVAVTNAGGAATITNSFGAVTVRDAKSDVTVQNQNGRVEADGVTGAADLRTTFEAVHFTRIGRSLTVHASNSNVTGDTVGGIATIETSFGVIELRGVKGSARATANNSTIRLTDIAGEVYAKTSFNGVTVEGVAGPVTVENSSGSITVRQNAGQHCQPVSLSTTFGPIRVTVPQGTGYDVTARTTFGHITSQPAISISGQMGGDALTGKIAGGGCPMRVIDQSGSIDIVN